MEALRAIGLCKSIQLPVGRRLTLLQSVDLTIECGETVAIVGRSGTGKSTLLAVLGLLTGSDSGLIEIAGRRVSPLNDRQAAQIRSEHIGFVFQNYSLLGHLNASGNVALPLRHGKSLPRSEVIARTRQAIELVGLADRAQSSARQLSGGEQQRVAIARALVRSPQILLADEPTGALDTQTADEVLAVLNTAAKTRGTGLVIVTHDNQVAARADRVLRLESGSLLAEPGRMPDAAPTT